MKIGQILRQLLFLTGSRDMFTKTVGEQPKGHLGLNSKAEEEEEEDDDDDDD